MKAEGSKKRRRSYLPAVEALEALRLLSSQASVLPGLPIPHELLGTDAQPVASPPVPLETWDAALVQAQLADLLGSSQVADSADTQAGLAQLDRYLNRAWYRAGISPQQHDDCTQAVYLTMLNNLGRDNFDSLLADVGRNGIRQVLSRDTEAGPDFFRAVDTVKKRAQRERSFQPLDDKAEIVGSPRTSVPSDWRGALQEAIDRSLSPREAALIYATIKGETPQEIALQWGVAPKTVSNEKTRVIQKLRDFLGAEMPD